MNLLLIYFSLTLNNITDVERIAARRPEHRARASLSLAGRGRGAVERRRSASPRTGESRRGQGPTSRKSTRIAGDSGDTVALARRKRKADGAGAPSPRSGDGGLADESKATVRSAVQELMDHSGAQMSVMLGKMDAMMAKVDSLEARNARLEALLRESAAGRSEFRERMDSRFDDVDGRLKRYEAMMEGSSATAHEGDGGDEAYQCKKHDGANATEKVGRVGPSLSALPPEVVAAIGSFCCRGALDSYMLTSKRIRDVCARGLSKPWPTNEGCSLVETMCPDHDDLPVGPEEIYYDLEEELQEVIPPLSGLMMLYDSRGPSFMVLKNEGICQNFDHDVYLKPPTMQVWSSACGLVYEEHRPFYFATPAITPPLGVCGNQFLVTAARRDDLAGVRMIQITKSPSQWRSLERDIESTKTQTFRLPCDKFLQVKCIGGSDDPCLIFMDRGESAVKLCRIISDGMHGQLRLSEPEVLASDPSRTGDSSTRRISLASFSNSKKSIIAFAYDFEDTHINILDIKRKVFVVVPTPKEAGWIYDAEFSPDGKMLAVAHCILGPYHQAAISLYDCDVVHIECMLQRPPRLYLVKGRGYCSLISFSPKGTKIAFRWHPQGVNNRRGIFGSAVAGAIDLSPPLKDNDGNSNVRIEVLNEATAWGKFISS